MSNKHKFKEGDTVIHKESGKRLKIHYVWYWSHGECDLRFKEIYNKPWDYYYDVSGTGFIKEDTRYKQKLLEFTKGSSFSSINSIRRFINYIKTEYKWKKYVIKVKRNIIDN